MKIPVIEKIAKKRDSLKTKLQDFLYGTGLFTNKKSDNIIVYRSLLNDIPFILLFFGGCIAFTLILFKQQTELHSSDWHFLLYRAILGISGLIFCLSLAFRKYNVHYQISLDGVQALRGILSNHQVDAKLEYYQIRGTEIHRSYFQRLIGTGDLHIHGSTSIEVQVAFLGISDPYRYDLIIKSRTNQVRK